MLFSTLLFFRRVLVVVSLLVAATWPGSVTAQQHAPGWAAAQVLPRPQPTNSVKQRFDAAGNRYVLATFPSTLTIGTTTLKSRGNNDLYLAKYAPDGTVLWVSQLGSAGFEYLYDLVVDPAGYAYVAGGFDPTEDMGQNGRLEIGNGLVVTSTLFRKVMLIRYSPEGKPLWVQQNYKADKGEPGVVALSLDSAGNLFVMGDYNQTINFAGGQLSNPNFYYRMYLASFTAATGAPRFMRVFLTENQSPGGVSVPVVGTRSGAYYACVNFTSAVRMDGTTYFSQYKLFSLLVRYAPDGSITWVRPLTSTGPLYNRQLAVDTEENVYVAGGFQGMLTLPEGTSAQTLTASTVKQHQALLLKFDAAGKLSWVRTVPGITYKSGSFFTSLALAPNGQVYAAGYLEGISEAHPSCLESAGKRDVLVASFTREGAAQWFQRGGGPNAEEASDVVPMASGNTWVLGTTEDKAVFGEQTISPMSGSNIFLAKLSPGLHTAAPCAPQALTPFPNPAREGVYLLGLPLPAAVEVVDVLGRRVFFTPQLTTCRFGLGGLKPGAYILRATTPEGCQYASRLVVK